MRTHLAVLPALVLFSIGSAAFAQSDPYAPARAAAANQLGIMEYCQGRGDVGADAVAAQRSVIARLPVSSANNDAEEALGKSGTLAAPNGANMTLDSMASAHATTVSDLCKKLGSSAIQSAAAFQQNGMAPGGMTMPKMPAMPNGMTVPTMPAGQPPQ